MRMRWGCEGRGGGGERGVDGEAQAGQLQMLPLELIASLIITVFSAGCLTARMKHVLVFSC